MNINTSQIVEQSHLEYLDNLRESGVTNMFGAGQYLESTFDLNRRDARTVLGYWMESFEERHEVKTVSVGDILDSIDKGATP
jgi:hypothetical protein